MYVCDVLIAICQLVATIGIGYYRQFPSYSPWSRDNHAEQRRARLSLAVHATVKARRRAMHWLGNPMT
jgi:hypothetical protein